MKFFKIVVLLFFVGIFSVLSARDFGKNDYRIYSADNGKEISMEKMAKRLAKYDVIFFGEWHDDELIHQLQAEILPLLDKKNKLAISMEMFERDVQSVMDNFLAGSLEEDIFLKKSRAWGNYLTDYKPIVDYAKENKLSVIAANIPRRYASLVSKQGVDAVNSISEEEKRFVAKALKPLDNSYKKQFFETMAGNMGRKNAMGMSSMLENIYAAQCFKDDTMAESIYEFLLENRGTQVIHYNGNFHSESNLGTANKLHILNPKLKIAIITPIVVADDEKIEYNSDVKDLGDFLIFAHRFSNDEEKVVEAPKMFQTVSNTIVNHKIVLEMDPATKYLGGFDEITLSKKISKNDTIYMLSALAVKNVSVNDKRVKYEIKEEDEDYASIIFPEDIDSNKIKIEYAGTVYFPLKGRELNQTHDGTMGIISDADDEGIYLPGANWYPIIGEGLADFDITVSCPEKFSLLTSGKETTSKKNGITTYNWKSELPVDHLYLVGNKFEVKSRIVNGVELRTYLLAEDAKFADTYLDGVDKYLFDYSKLFGAYPFSSFSVVENFFASGFGMPNFTLLAKEIVKMPFVTLSPGVIAHEFCHNWWGNSVYVDYETGNWCEAITVFSSNYYQNIINEDYEKAINWRKKAILENNLLPKEKQFPLREFIYQHNDDEAVIGYEKGAMLFVYLYQQYGKDVFFQTIKDFYRTNQGKIANWADIEAVFEKHNPAKEIFSVHETFEFWLNSIDLPHIRFDEVKYNNGELSFSLINTAPVAMQIPIQITLENGEVFIKKVNLKGEKTLVALDLEAKPTIVEIDPDAYILKKISDQSMPYNLNRTLNDSPLIILPQKGEMISRLQMVASMISRSGYEIEIKPASEVTEDELKNNSLFIFGEIENNSVYSKIDFPAGIKLNNQSIEIEGKNVSGLKGSAIFSFGSTLNSEKMISVYLWNSEDAIASFRKMFHYMNDSWQLFDLDIKKNAALNRGQFFPEGKNDLIYTF